MSVPCLSLSICPPVVPCLSTCPTCLSPCLSSDISGHLSVVTDELIFCGCSDGTVRAFSPVKLHFLCTLPRHTSFGADIANMVDASQLFSHRSEVRYPDKVAVTYDPCNHWLSCVYNDHSGYCTLRGEGQVVRCVSPRPSCPLLRQHHQTGSIDGLNVLHRNILSQDLQRVTTTDGNILSLLDTDSIIVAGGNTDKAGSSGAEGQQSDQSRAGIRTLRVSPDGRHLAMETSFITRHRSPVLATASRDRLIHVLDAGSDYSLVQTLDEHSSSITAVRFAANEGKVRMISCGADKSVYFRTAQQVEGVGLEFTRTHHVVRKTTLYDMDVEPTRKYAAVGCQDRSIRIFNISNGKQKKVYKGSLGEDGTLIKSRVDHQDEAASRRPPSYRQGHSSRMHHSREQETEQGAESPRVVTMSSDSDKEEEEDEEEEELSCPYMVTAGSLEEADETFGCPDAQRRRKVVSSGRLPRRRWSRRTGSADGVLMVKSMLDLRLLDSYCPDRQEAGQEAEQQVFVPPPAAKEAESGCGGGALPDQSGIGQYRQSTGHLCLVREPDENLEENLRSTLVELTSCVSVQVEDDEARTNQRPDFILLSNQSPDREDPVLYPDQWEDSVSLAGSEFQVKEACPAAAGGRQDKPSPDSGCSLGFSSRLSSPDRPAGDDSEPTELIVDGNSSELEDEDDEDGGRAPEVVMSQQVPQTPDQEAFLKENFVVLADRSASGSPSRASHSSTESLSISSRFLSQNPPGSRAVFPLPSWSSGGGGGGGVGEVKTRPLVSEVRPLMEEGLNRSQDRRVSWNQDQTQNQEQNQMLYHNRTNQDQARPPPVKAAEEEPPPRPSPLKKKIQESRRNRPSPAHLNPCGLRKSQSVHSLLCDTGDPPSRPSREVPPQVLTPPQRPTTLPSSPRRPTSSTLLTPQRPSPASPRSPQQDTPTATMGRKSSSSSTVPAPRSYMSPTASSMAKMSRSVSMGDGLNVADPSEDTAMTSSLPSAATKDMAPPPVAIVSSNAALATPPHAAVIPVVAASSLSSGNHGNQATPTPRGLQARVPAGSRPLPDKPSLATRGGASDDHKWRGGQRAGRCHRFGSSSSSSSLTSSSSSSSSSFALHHLTPPPSPSLPPADLPVTVDTCRALTNELRSCFKRATHLYRQVNGSSTDDSTPDQHQMAVLLSEAFMTMRAELDSLPLGASTMGVEGGLEGVGEEKTAALLEEYSLLLLQAVHRRINTSSY
ncbi:hypothetical protein INR49_007076 [Caranx melampygus]|nr:hypothetical protein INR49_007076 [Caranx melampygus]